jgi:hypothetical protein
MKPTTIIKFYLILIIFSFLSFAQNQVKSGVIASGGGMMESSSYKVTGTIGQPAIGISANQINQLISGFWYEVLTPTNAEEEKDFLPAKFQLEQNYPNPFNPSTVIRYGLPKTSNVIIEVFDITGQRIEKLVNEEKPAGYYEVTFNASNLASGMYFYRIQAGAFTLIKKMILLR